MFIAIATTDHTNMLDNCDVECWNGYWTETDNPIFMDTTFARVCKAIKNYYRALDDDVCPDYAIYEVNDREWAVNGTRTIILNVDRQDA